MILTRYKGVDVTPHTFNNLIKTITNQRSVSNTSASKTNFEDKIREIILAFNPNLKKSSADMTTEYLLINCLKVNEKKEVTHTYNYNTWGDKKYNADGDEEEEDDEDRDEFYNDLIDKLNIMSTSEWNDDIFMDFVKTVGGQKGKQYVKKIKKKYTKYIENLKHKKNNSNCETEIKNSIENNKEDVIANFKILLGVKKLDKEKCCSLLNSVKQFVNKWTELDDNDSYDTIEKYIYGIRTVNQTLKNNDVEKNDKIVSLQTKITSLQTEIDNLKSNLDSCANKEDELNQFRLNTDALKKHIENLTKQNKKNLETINYNVIEIAKLGAEVGERDALIEEMQSKHKITLQKLNDIRNEIETLNFSYNEITEKWNKLDEENSQLITDKSKLLSRINELEEELKRVTENAIKNEKNCYDLLNKKDKDYDDKNREQQNIVQLCENLKIENQTLLNDKHLLIKQLEETNKFNEELKTRYLIEAKQSQDQLLLIEQKITDKEYELAACKGRCVDKEKHYMQNLEEYLNVISKLKNDNETLNAEKKMLTKENSQIKNDNNNLKNFYDEGCEAINKESKLQSEYKKLQMYVETLKNDFAKEKTDYKNQIETIKEELDEIIIKKEIDIKKKLYIENEKEKERQEKEKNDIIEKLESEKLHERQEFETKINELKNKFEQEKICIIKQYENKNSSGSRVVEKKFIKPEKRKHETIVTKITDVVKSNTNLSTKKIKSAHVLPIQNSSFVKPNTNKN
ncbi:desmoplakin [Pieris rapae granulovirus Wuhan]|uniref:Desmoplakin n=1 Tax=Pieris rapae granulovirus Wuhan TaxID=2848030 RepID=D2J4R1_9BBAC|nr:desmoplakin [Betabaculovirus arrapae]ACZ63580.1 desmoplakin [Betabaculovirus arrapae]AGS18851.1 desmoplakin [Pieris rapae granulovirus]UOS85766.1 desmoplakin [Pieris rapae granulovirus]